MSMVANIAVSVVVVAIAAAVQDVNIDVATGAIAVFHGVVSGACCSVVALLDANVVNFTAIDGCAVAVLANGIVNVVIEADSVALDFIV